MIPPDNSPTVSSVALTGATGFIGTRLLSLLSQSGIPVYALYRPQKSTTLPELPGVKWIAGDMNHRSALDTLIANVDTVIHCAGAVRGKNLHDFNRVNATGTQNIVDAINTSSHTPRLILVSSLAAREPHLSHYAKSKWQGEQIVRSHLQPAQWSIIRPPAVFGPGDKEIQPLFQGIAKGFVPIPGNQHARFSMIYVDDLASAIVSLLLTERWNGQIFEIDDGRDNGYNWDSVVEIACRVLNKTSPVRKVLIPPAILNTLAWLNLGLAHVFRYSPMLSPGKVRELMHSDWVCTHNAIFSDFTAWQPQYPLEEGLRQLYQPRIN